MWWGHLHFGGINNKEDIKKIFHAWYNNPWIVWAFTMPDDTGASDNFAVSHHNLFKFYEDFESYIRFQLAGDSLFLSKTCGVIRNEVAKGVTTLEFRCIEAPYNHSEFRDQYEFFVRFVNWCIAEPLQPLYDNGTRTKKDLQNIPVNMAEFGFRKLLFDLKLSAKRYDKYVKRNLIPRWDSELKRFRN